jgi:hypothetical protein
MSQARFISYVYSRLDAATAADVATPISFRPYKQFQVSCPPTEPSGADKSSKLDEAAKMCLLESAKQFITEVQGTRRAEEGLSTLVELQSGVKSDGYHLVHQSPNCVDVYRVTNREGWFGWQSGRSTEVVLTNFILIHNLQDVEHINLSLNSSSSKGSSSSIDATDTTSPDPADVPFPSWILCPSGGVASSSSLDSESKVASSPTNASPMDLKSQLERELKNVKLIRQNLKSTRSTELISRPPPHVRPLPEASGAVRKFKFVVNLPKGRVAPFNIPPEISTACSDTGAE